MLDSAALHRVRCEATNRSLRREADAWPRWAQHGVLLFPGHGHAAPPPLEPKGEWKGPFFSQSQQANYWQNVRTKQSIFERERVARPMSFRNCVSSCLRWEGAAPGEVEEAHLHALADAALQALADAARAKQAQQKEGAK